MSLSSLLYNGVEIAWLLAAVAAVVISIVARRKHPKRATYAMIGFGLFALGGLFTPVWFRVIYDVTDGDVTDLLEVVGIVVRLLIDICGVAMLLLVVFAVERPKQPAGPSNQPPPQQYPGQPQQQYPGHQPLQPPAPQQYPEQRPPQQQPPPQQYPGQQYPGQYPGQR